MKYLVSAFFFAVLLIIGCSKSSNSPTAPAPQPTDIHIVNNTLGIAEIMVRDTNRTINPSDSIILHYNDNPGSIPLSGHVYVLDGNNQLIGTSVPIVDTLRNVSSTNSRYVINLNSNYFALVIQNQTGYVIDQIKVNYLASNESTVNVNLSSGAVRSQGSLGFYPGSSGTAIYAHLVSPSPLSLIWHQGTDFNLGNGKNQSISLTAAQQHRTLDFVCVNKAPYSTVCQIGNDIRGILPGDSTTYHYADNPHTVTISAETAVRNGSNVVLGLDLSWSAFTVNVDSVTTYRQTFNVPSTYFLLKIRNTSTYTFYQFDVNYQTSYQISTSANIPSDGITYTLGYYNAFSSTVIYGHTSGLTDPNYTWRNGIEFNLPNTNNQSITLHP